MTVAWIALGVALFDLWCMLGVVIAALYALHRTRPALETVKPMLAMFGPTTVAPTIDDLLGDDAVIDE